MICWLARWFAKECLAQLSASIISECFGQKPALRTCPGALDSALQLGSFLDDGVMGVPTALERCVVLQPKAQAVGTRVVVVTLLDSSDPGQNPRSFADDCNLFAFSISDMDFRSVEVFGPHALLPSGRRPSPRRALLRGGRLGRGGDWLGAHSRPERSDAHAPRVHAPDAAACARPNLATHASIGELKFKAELRVDFVFSSRHSNLGLQIPEACDGLLLSPSAEWTGAARE